jgi:Xaa-Pro aminopeptidase
MTPFPKHIQVQEAAKQVLSRLGTTIGPDSTERSIATTAHQMLSDLGYPNTWYHDCPALVLLGSRSCLSVSGKEYEPADEPVGEVNLVTVDLSPAKDDFWGDCARSFVVEGGRVVQEPDDDELAQGFQAEGWFHEQLVKVARPSMTFSELHKHVCENLSSKGYENLDFMGNFGHSIERNLEERVWFDASNHAQLGSVRMFTFEPHIRRFGGKWGFKHENIYYFEDEGRLREL